MAIDPPPLPSEVDAIEFYKLVDSARVIKNALRNTRPMDDDGILREEITNHSIYVWVLSHREFHRVIRYLEGKGITGDYPPSLKIEISYCIARMLHMYIILKLHPERIKRTTAASAAKALKHINELQILLGADIQMENFMEKIELSILLKKLNLELSGETTTTYLKSKKGDVLAMKLVAELYRLISKILGEAPTYVMSELITIMYPVSGQSVRRYVKKLSAKS
jgi:hypothetical protein